MSQDEKHKLFNLVQNRISRVRDPMSRLKKVALLTKVRPSASPTSCPKRGCLEVHGGNWSLDPVKPRQIGKRTQSK
jgi:hypothetical protein